MLIKKIVFIVLAVFFVSFVSSYAADLGDQYNDCFNSAGNYYHVSPVLLKSIAIVESGLNQNAVNYDSDGTYDMGIMQVNSSWKKTIGNLRWDAAKRNVCYNIFVGAWILSKCVRRFGYNWQAVSCYNAGERGRANNKYAKQVYLTFLRQSELASVSK